MNNPLITRLYLEIADPYNHQSLNAKNLHLANAERGISRELYISSNTSLFKLHLIIQKLFGWKDFFPHRFTLSNKDFDNLTHGKPDIYSNFCGTLFRPIKAQSFDWCWHDFRDDSELALCGVMVDGSFVYCKKFCDPENLESKVQKLNEDANCLIERLTLREILKPYQKDKVDAQSFKLLSEWIKKTVADSDSCMKRLMDFKTENPEEFNKECNALTELDRWKESYECLLRIRYNPAAIEARYGLRYTDAEKLHRDMLISCFEHSRNLVENYNPMPETFFNEITYKYDRVQKWEVRIHCLDIFEKKDSIWIGGLEKEIPKEERELLDKVYNTQSPVCSDYDGVFLMDNIGGISGFFDFLRVLKGSDKESSKKLRGLAEIYGWKENDNPKDMRFKT